MLTWSQKRQIKKSTKQLKKKLSSPEFKEQLKQAIANMDKDELVNAITKMTSAIQAINKLNAKTDEDSTK